MNIADIWLQTLPFFLTYVVHQFWLAPLWIRRRQKLRYIVGVTSLLLAFCVAIQFTQMIPSHNYHDAEPDHFHPEIGLPSHDKSIDDFLFPPFGHSDCDDDYSLDSLATMPHADSPFLPRLELHPPQNPADWHPIPHPRPFHVMKDLLKFIVALLMLGINFVGVHFASHTRERLRLEELEREDLKHQLAYLRYQINPHFLMNTLNNIHALVDIDAEKAKECIVVLSRLMRHMLYDTNASVVPFSIEEQLLQHYITLMRLRYTHKVNIDCKLEASCAMAEVPPLVLTTIVENAFKHGVSYQQESYIHIAAHVEGGKLFFSCKNSRHPQSQSFDASGTGLENVRKRLQLLYGSNATLYIDAGDTSYELLLVIPSQVPSSIVGND